MKVYRADEEKAERFLERLDTRSARVLSDQTIARARAVIAEIRRRGDAALARHIRTLDLAGLEAREVRLAGGAGAAGAEVADEVARAIDAAIESVQKFHRSQVLEGFTEEHDGTWASWRLRPVQSVGVIVPGHEHPQLTEAVMAVVPARLAGVPRIAVAVSPRAYLGSAALRYLLRRLEVEEVYLMSGAHAVAALAYGTESVSPVDLVVGSGDALTMAAKLLVARDVAVDQRGGPPEVVIVADAAARPELVAADLLAQLEHDADALGVVVVASQRLARRVDARVRSAIRPLPKGHPVREALKRWGAILVVRDLDEACALANRIAPSRVQLMVEDPLRLADRVESAALVLLGPWTPPAVADVLSGANHVVPTLGRSLARGPLGVADFYRASCLVRIAAHHYPKMARNASVLAEAEGLPLHAASLVAGERGER